MISLGLRLTFGAGRDAIVRLVIVAAAVALGVGMLLCTLAALNGTTAQNQRNAWLNTGRDGAVSAGPAQGDPTYWKLSADYYQGHILGRIDVAPTGPHPPLPPGMTRLPAPGEYYASPALAELITTLPAGELADRFPGKLVGTIGDAALPGPDSLVAIVGHAPAELAAQPRVAKVTSIVGTRPDQCASNTCNIGTGNSGMILILSTVALALILPVLILIGTATRLAATRREQRFAAMRLVGATPRQVAMVSAAEASVASVIGTVLGFGAFAVMRLGVVHLNLTETPFFLSDLSLTAKQVIAVLLLVPAASVVSARVALRRVQISPLGVTRRATPKPPRAWRLIPIAAGLAELAYFIGRRPATTADQAKAFTAGGFLIIFGIVLAGPWLTMAGARLLARFTSRPALLLAGRRLADDPRSGYRAVSGLVLALCIMSGTVGIITAMIDDRQIPAASADLAPSLVSNQWDIGSDGKAKNLQPGPSQSTIEALRAVPGVTGVAVVYQDASYRWNQNSGWGGGLVSCAEAASIPAFGACAPGLTTAKVPSEFEFMALSARFRDGDPWPTTWSTPAGVSVDELRSLPVGEVIVTDDGSVAAVERARTILNNTYPHGWTAGTVREAIEDRSSKLNGYIQLANVIILITFPIAGCSLAVAVAGSLSDRKRPFSLMRLSGVQLGVLRRVVLLETVAPLLAVSAVAIATGLLGAHLFLRAQLDSSLRMPGTAYFWMVGGGMAFAVAIIASTLPLLRRITGPEVARND